MGLEIHACEVDQEPYLRFGFSSWNFSNERWLFTSPDGSRPTTIRGFIEDSFYTLFKEMSAQAIIGIRSPEKIKVVKIPLSNAREAGDLDIRNSKDDGNGSSMNAHIKVLIEHTPH